MSVEKTMKNFENSVRKLWKDGKYEELLQIIYVIKQNEFLISQQTASLLLQVCIKRKDLLAGRQVQSLIVKSGLHSVPLLGDHLIRLFASCGNLQGAEETFRIIQNPTVYTWNAIISAHAAIDGSKALGLFQEMHQVGITPDIVTFLSVVRACAQKGALFKGREIHDQAIRQGLDCRAFSNSLVDMYAKCSSLEDACRVFDRLDDRTVVSWGAIMGAYTENDDCGSVFELFERLKQDAIEPNKVIFLYVLKACTLLRDIRQGHLVHYEIIKVGLDQEQAIGNTLLDMYAKLGCLYDTCKIFEKLSDRTVTTWDVRISGLVQHGHHGLALEMFKHMLLEGLTPDGYTFSSILKACAMEGTVGHIKMLHDQVVKCNLESSLIVMNTLIDVYGKSGYVDEACCVFEALPNKDIISWGALITSCIQHGLDHRGLGYFEKMLLEGFFPNEALYIAALKACTMVGTSLQGRLLHDHIIRSGIGLGVNIGSSLINVYGKLGHLQEAGKVFYLMKHRNEVVWGLLVAVYVEYGFYFPALKIFTTMQEDGTTPSKACFLCMLKVCGKLGAIDSRLIHGQITDTGFPIDVEVASALVDMYVKCGSLSDAYMVVKGFPNGNTVLWGAMISGFAHAGLFKKAGECVQTMECLGLKLDHVIFTDLLCGCTNAGLLREGCGAFTCMKEVYGIEPLLDHYNSMIDLFGQAGLVQEAENLLLSMPSPSDIFGWISLLSSCKKYCNIDLATRCLPQVI